MPFPEIYTKILFVFSSQAHVPEGNIVSDASLITRGESVFEEYAETDEEYAYSAADYAGLKLYYTAHGKKWHLTRECQYIRNSGSIDYTDYDTAVARGLTPCSKCGYPGQIKD